MDEKLKVEIVSVKPKLRDKKVVIYARVSSSSTEQLKSLQAQVSGLTRFVRDTVEVLNAFEKLKQSNTQVFFFGEGIDSSKDDTGLYITVHTTIVQAENENRTGKLKATEEKMLRIC